MFYIKESRKNKKVQKERGKKREKQKDEIKESW
jgi:hypothetical protein